MRFDDRLMTVLDQPASDPHDRAVRWRQLVDLVARAGAQANNPLVEQALELIRGDRAGIDEALRAAAARAIASLPLPFELIALFASDTLVVAAPVLAAARLDPDERKQLLDIANPETGNFIVTLHPPASGPSEASDSSPPESERPLLKRQDDPPRGAAIPSISDVVARIDRLRRARSQEPSSFPLADAQHGGAVPSLFRWECGPSGEIAWVEGAPRGALIGRSIARGEDGEGVDQEVERAFAMRAPFHDGHLSLAGSGVLAGEWKISGVPAFERIGGRFAGYRGIALREGVVPGANGTNGFAPAADPDSLRELVHEIKTPLNAIIGFAEIIDGQYLGPADRHYRTRAAEIVSQARLLLSAIDDLDFAAKLQADRDRPGGGTDLSLLLEQIAAGMRSNGATGERQLDLAIETDRRRCALEPALTERLVTRFCDAVLAESPGVDRILIHLGNSPGRCLLWIEQPVRRSGGGGEEDLGFGLRLVRGLARIAGGDLTLSAGRVTLELPEL